MADTLVFVPAWNEEQSLPAVLGELRAALPAVDVLVVDDGSADATARVAAEGGARVLSFGENRGLRAAVAAGYTQALEGGYAYVGRVDADGQHPAAELARLLALVHEGEADVAVGSRFAADSGHQEHRYRSSLVRRAGSALVRRAMGAALDAPFADAMSGMTAAGARALPVLARPYESGAPEVEALLRLREEGLRVVEVPVHMRPRASGESKLRGAKAADLVLTVAATLLLYGIWRRLRPARHRLRRG